MGMKGHLTPGRALATSANGCLLRAFAFHPDLNGEIIAGL